MRLDRCALCGACPAASASKCMQLGFLRHIAAPRGGAPPRSRRNRATHRATSNGADRSEHNRMHLRTPLAVLWSSWPLHRSRPRHLTMPPAPGGSHLCRFPPSRFRAACPFGRYCAPCLRCSSCPRPRSRCTTSKWTATSRPRGRRRLGASQTRSAAPPYSSRSAIVFDSCSPKFRTKRAQGGQASFLSSGGGGGRDGGLRTAALVNGRAAVRVLGSASPRADAEDHRRASSRVGGRGGKGGLGGRRPEVGCGRDGRRRMTALVNGRDATRLTLGSNSLRGDAVGSRGASSHAHLRRVRQQDASRVFPRPACDGG